MLDAALIIITALVNLGVSLAVMRVELRYLRRDVDEDRRSLKAAHWRLDEVGAPPAPSDVR